MVREISSVMLDLRRGLRELSLSHNEYLRAASFYDGRDPEVFISPALQAYLQDSVDAFKLNLASIPVDVVADRLYVSNFSTPESNLSEVIDAIAESNDLWLWAHDVMREAEKYGDYYVGVFLDANSRPVLSPIDPLTTRVIYDAELQRMPEFAIRSWEVNYSEDDSTSTGFLGHEHESMLMGQYTTKIERATVYYPDATYKFIKNQVGVWEPYEEDGVAYPLVNPHNIIPIIHFRNALPYGKPGHYKAYGVQQIITKAILNMVANIDFMSFRQKYAMTKPEHLTSTTVPEPTPRTKSGTTTTTVAPSLTTGPGKLWKLIAHSVGEFSPTEADQFLKLLDWAVITIARSTRLPTRFFMDHSGQQPSAASQQENDKALKALVSARRRSFGYSWSQVMDTALSQLGIKGEVNVEWEKEQVESSQEFWESASTLTDLIYKALTNTQLQPFVKAKLVEAGYSIEEVEEFLTIVTDSNIDIDSSEVSAIETTDKEVPR